MTSYRSHCFFRELGDFLILEKDIFWEGKAPHQTVSDADLDRLDMNSLRLYWDDMNALVRGDLDPHESPIAQLLNSDVE